MLAAGAPTKDEYLTRIIAANNVYRVTGMPCMPWEVDALPDDWMDAIDAYLSVPELRKNGS